MNEVNAKYEQWNVDEDGPLAVGLAVAIVRAGRGLAVTRFGIATKESAERAATRLDELAKRLHGIQDQFEARLLSATITRRAAVLRLNDYRLEVTPYRSFMTFVPMLFRNMDTVDPRCFAETVASFAAYVASIEAELRASLALGRSLLHRALITSSVAQLRAGIDESGRQAFLPNGASGGTRDEFIAIVRDRLVPTVASLATYLEADYALSAAERLGCVNLTGGEKAYRELASWSTSLSTEPENLYALGVDAVGRCEDAMTRLRERLGRPDAELFHRQLREGPLCRPRYPEEIGEMLHKYAHQATLAMRPLFARFPVTKWAVERLSGVDEAAMTFGYYQQPSAVDAVGTYYYNGSQHLQRSLLSVSSLALHELIPGHHFQICTVMENKNLSTSRRDPLSNDNVDGYAEGWSEYAADLGFEAGVYETDLERYGRHATDVFMSARLVVDTGLNALGWTAEKARGYLRQHTLLTEVEITTEVDRYGGDLPGQALCYKAGMLEFVRLRRIASDHQGGNFDVARYHQYLINAGNLPFDLLAAHIDRFTEDETVK